MYARHASGTSSALRASQSGVSACRAAASVISSPSLIGALQSAGCDCEGASSALSASIE